MNLEELANKIVSAENPYDEFSKEASSLSSLEKTTLAREVNKKMFLSSIETKSSDGNILFDVIEPEIKGTHDISTEANQNISKTASEKNQRNIISKSQQITSDMFSFDTDIKKTASSKNIKRLHEQRASEFFEYQLEKTAEKNLFLREKEFSDIVKKASFELEEEYMKRLYAISDIAVDAQEMRTILTKVASIGNDDILDGVARAMDYPAYMIKEASSVNIDSERLSNVESLVDEAEKIAEAKSELAGAKKYEDIATVSEKVAFIGSILRFAGKALGKGAVSATNKIGTSAGKGAVSLAKGAVKNPKAVIGVGGLGLLTSDVANKSTKYENIMFSRNG